MRVSVKRHVFNVRRKDTLHDATKMLTKALDAKDIASAEKLLAAVYKAIDKAMKRGVIKSNTANRKKSRLAISIKRARA